jgi:hypothetical protein
MPTEIELLREEFARQNEEKQRQFDALVAETQRRQEAGKPLPAAATLRNGYAQSEADREAAKQAAREGEAA